jgi:hypothetical protein
LALAILEGRIGGAASSTVGSTSGSAVGGMAVASNTVEVDAEGERIVVRSGTV